MLCGDSDTNFGNKRALARLRFSCRFRFEVPHSIVRPNWQELQIGGTSVVLDLTFAWRIRGNTEANVKSTTLARPGFRICAGARATGVATSCAI
jgi:hypothetical protein